MNNSFPLPPKLLLGVVSLREICFSQSSKEFLLNLSIPTWDAITEAVFQRPPLNTKGRNISYRVYQQYWKQDKDVQLSDNHQQQTVILPFYH